MIFRFQKNLSLRIIPIAHGIIQVVVFSIFLAGLFFAYESSSWFDASMSLSFWAISATVLRIVADLLMTVMRACEVVISRSAD
jgi:hypothetical protein